MHEPIICDLDHNPLKRPRSCIASEVGETLPCLIGHGTLWHTGIRRPMLAAEMLVAMGCNVCPEVNDSTEPPVWPLGALIEEGVLEPNGAINLAGNAWHLQTIGPIFMYVLASVQPRPVEIDEVSSEEIFDEDSAASQLLDAPGACQFAGSGFF